MANAMDYLSWRGDLSFRQASMNEIDGFLCSQLSYPDYAGIADRQPVTIAQASCAYFQSHTEDVSNLGVLQAESVLPMLRRMADCPRYREVTAEGYENTVSEKEREQFSAITLILDDGTRVISYRGTDDTIVGWRENFCLAVMESTPAQQDAADYLLRHAGDAGKLVLVGHSKGGNLAVYAASNVPRRLQERIDHVYNFDGPGFMDAFLEQEGYRNVSERITTVISQHSVVGVLMKTPGQLRIVKSNVIGPLAHDGFRWDLMGTSFTQLPEISAASSKFEEAADGMVFGTEPEKMNAFIRDFFDALQVSGARTLTDLTRMDRNETLEILKALHSSRNVSQFAGEFAEKLLRAMF